MTINNVDSNVAKILKESAILSNKICRILEKIPPNGFAYELFLDEKEKKYQSQRVMEFQ